MSATQSRAYPSTTSWVSIPASFVRFRDLSSDDRWFLLVVVGFFSQGVLNTVGGAIGQFIPFVTGTGFSAAVILLPFCLYLFERISRRRAIHLMPFIVVYFLLTVAMMFSFSMHPEYGEVMFDETFEGNINSILFTPLAPVLAFLVVTMAPSASVMIRGLTYAAYLTFAGNLVRMGQATQRGSWTTLNSRGVEIETSYNLGFGYSVLFCVVVFAFLALAGHRFYLHMLGAFAGVVMILTNGSRAPLGIAVGAIVLFAIYFRKRVFFSSPLRVTGAVISALGLIFIALNLNAILLRVQSLLDSLGIESRTFERLATGTIADDRARNILGEMSADLIATGGLFGHGLFGDRFFIQSRFRWGYPHNIVDELLITFGAVGGVLLIGALLFFIVFAIVKSRGTVYCDVIILLLPMTFQLWVSLSYLLSIWFWALLGACWMAIRESQGAKRQGLFPQSLVGATATSGASGDAASPGARV